MGGDAVGVQRGDEVLLMKRHGVAAAGARPMHLAGCPFLIVLNLCSQTANPGLKSARLKLLVCLNIKQNSNNHVEGTQGTHTKSAADIGWWLVIIAMCSALHLP